MTTTAITLLGSDCQTGSYLLRIHVTEPLRLAFGRFRGGDLIPVPAGDYVYLGSAMAQRGSSSLAIRLLRHATRSKGNFPHRIRAPMLAVFRVAGLGPASLAPPASKKLFWHIDHLLDQPRVEIMQAFVLRSHLRLEAEMAHLLANDSHTSVLAPGLGATDVPPHTHLLRVNAEEWWWQSLADVLRQWGVAFLPSRTTASG